MKTEEADCIKLRWTWKVMGCSGLNEHEWMTRYVTYRYDTSRSLLSGSMNKSNDFWDFSPHFFDSAIFMTWWLCKKLFYADVSCECFYNGGRRIVSWLCLY